jgi:uncharacterized cupredoxin-like copper-binding protein
VASPGTADNPRVIKLDETASLTITDPDGNKVTSIAAVAGETLKFEITNSAGFDHNFYIGNKDDLAGGNTANAAGIPAFISGTQTFTYTVPDSGPLHFACTLPGHFSTMNGTIDIQAASGGAGAGTASPGPTVAP